MESDRSIDDLVDYFDDGLPEARRSAVAAHLDECDTCRQLVVSAREVDAWLRDATVPMPALPTAREILLRARRDHAIIARVRQDRRHP